MSSKLVHLIDDDEDVRRAIAFLLGTAGLAVRVHENADAFLAQDAPDPGVIVSDVRMPGTDGLGLLRKLVERGLDMPVVIMTGHADVPLAVEAMKAGAVDFIEKPFTDAVLLAAVEVALSRTATANRDGAAVMEVRARLARLTPREREVLAGLVAGHPNKTIAYDLGLSARTVEVHRANVMTKMEAPSLSVLVRQALQAGFS